jgi:hypothetical protein
MLEDINVSLKLKLAMLWVSLMFIYIYIYYFALYMPKRITDILQEIIFKFDLM